MNKHSESGIRVVAGNQVSDAVSITILKAIKIKNLDAPAGVDPFADNASVIYRAAKTHFQAIGYRADDTEIGPVSVEWGLEGGEVVASEQLRLGILAGLGSLGAGVDKIGAFDLTNVFGTWDHIASSPTVTFGSFLPGNITITAKRGTLSDSIAIRIKQPGFKVNVYPVEGVDVSEIFPIWKTTVEQVWNKESILKVESVNLMPSIPNVAFPDPPVSPPAEGAETLLQDERGTTPSLLNPLYYDYLLGKISGLFVPPRLSSLLITHRPLIAVNIYVVRRPWSCWFDESFSPPKRKWYSPYISTISARNYFLPIIGAGSLTLWETGTILKENKKPYIPQYPRFLAAGVGSLFGLPQNAEWLNNLMDFSPVGGLVVTPDQYITALNYRGDNPESSNYILEE